MTQRRLSLLILCGLLLLFLFLIVGQVANVAYIDTLNERATVAAQATGVMGTLELLRTITP